jgi:hypothetical protein
MAKMIQELIDREFKQMITRHRIHRCLGITSAHVKVLRHQVRTGQRISLDKKLKLLTRSGWDPAAAKWTDQEMINLVQFVLKASDTTRGFGAFYLFEKWKGPGS